VLLFSGYHYTTRESDDTAAYAAMKARSRRCLAVPKPEALF
jgi:hypothetical protein